MEFLVKFHTVTLCCDKRPSSVALSRAFITSTRPLTEKVCSLFRSGQRFRRRGQRSSGCHSSRGRNPRRNRLRYLTKTHRNGHAFPKMSSDVASMTPLDRSSSPEVLAGDNLQSQPHRKCGVSKLGSQNSTTNTTTNSVQVNVKKKRSVDAVVEAYLDEHPEFLNDYIKRKVSRRQLEQWLFLPFVQTGPSSSGVGGGESQMTIPPSGKITHSSDSNLLGSKTGTLLSCVRGQHGHERQRSRSFTPLRKLSATTFEAGGLATPILNVTSDGQPSFLRTTTQTIHPSSPTSLSSSSAAPNNDWNVEPVIASSAPVTIATSNSISNAGSNHSESIKNRKDLLLKLLPSMMQKSETLSFAKCLLTSANLLMGQADRVDLLVMATPNSFEGTIFSLINDTVIKQTADLALVQANPFLYKTITSSKVLNVRNISGNMVLPESKLPNFLISNALMGPLFKTEATPDDAIGCLQLYNKVGGFTDEDEELFRHLTLVASLAMVNLQSHQEMRLELARSEVFLELARTVFREPTRLETTMLTILTNFLSLIDCDRCQISLSDAKNASIFRRIFDLSRSEINLDLDSPFENRLPIDSECAAQVAITGAKVNLKPDQLSTKQQNSEIKSFLCLPIHDPDGRVVGVISLANKEANAVSSTSSSPDNGHYDSVNYFTSNDERFVEAFSIFCGMAIRNAADYEKAVVSEAKLQVAFEVMNYQSTSPSDETNVLSNLPVPAASSINIDSFDFSYLKMDDHATLTVCSAFHFTIWLIFATNNY